MAAAAALDVTGDGVEQPAAADRKKKKRDREMRD